MNRELAGNRLVSLEKGLERTPVLEKRYKETISQHISKGYARKSSQNEIRNKSYPIIVFSILRNLIK